MPRYALDVLRALNTMLKPEHLRSPINDIGPPRLPYELIDVLVDTADHECLFKLSLVSRYLMRRCRTRLFHTLSFIEPEPTFSESIPVPKGVPADTHFDRFLDLLEYPNNTIGPIIGILHISHLFHRLYFYKQRNNLHKLASRLTHLKSVRLSSITWQCIPRHILDFLLALRATKVQIEWTNIYSTSAFIELLKSPLIRYASNNLSFYDTGVGPVTECDQTYTLAHDLHFASIDNRSLANFCKYWNPVEGKTRITVDSFHLLPDNRFPPNVDSSTGVRFLQMAVDHLGPNLLSLCIIFDTKGTHNYNDQLNLSRCTGVKKLYVGSIRMDEQHADDLDAMWSTLIRLPPSPIETVGIRIEPSCSDGDDFSARMDAFPWVSIVRRLRDVIPSVERVNFTFGNPVHNQVPEKFSTPPSPKLSRLVCQDVRRKVLDVTRIEVGFEALGGYTPSCERSQFPWRECSS